MKKTILLIAAAILLGVLIVVYVPFAPASPQEGVGQKPTAPLVGADKDVHGCIASAGYTYSVVRQECVRVWEVGTALMPTIQIGEPVLAAYVIRSANWQHAEVFLPGQEGSFVLTLQAAPGDSTWTDTYGTWKLTYDKIQGWKLFQDGQAVYTAGPDKA